MESSAAVDRQAAHRGCGHQAAHTKPTFPPPDGFDEEDDGYVASLLLANDVWTRHKGGDFCWPQAGTFTWPRAKVKAEIDAGSYPKGHNMWRGADHNMWREFTRLFRSEP